METHKRSTEVITALAKQKSEEAAKKVENAIKELIKNKKEINFNSVVTESGVSKSYLYNHPEFRKRIETLRKQQRQITTTSKSKIKKSDESKDVIIEALRYKVNKLEDELKQVKEENKKLNGVIYNNL